MVGSVALDPRSPVLFLDTSGHSATFVNVDIAAGHIAVDRKYGPRPYLFLMWGT